MAHVTIPAELKSLLGDLTDPLILVDESGKRLGVFSPAAGPSLYEGVDSPASDAELLERLRNPARVSHEEVMRKARELQ